MKTNEGAMDLALLFIRLALGAIFIVHGAQKLFPGLMGGEGMSGFTKFVETLQVPAPQVMAYLAAISEFGGGILVLLGLFARIGGLAIAGVMIVAIVKVHLKNGFFADNKGYEYQLALLSMALAVAIAGAGRIGLGTLVGRKKKVEG
jgi:putative oxidoreductase